MPPERSGLVGVMMCASLSDIKWNDLAVAIPAFLTIVIMPLTFSIATGLAGGFLTYVLVTVVSGRAREVHWFMYMLTVLFGVFFAVR